MKLTYIVGIPLTKVEIQEGVQFFFQEVHSQTARYNEIGYDEQIRWSNSHISQIS